MTINVSLVSDINYLSKLAVVILSIKKYMKTENVNIYVITDVEEDERINKIIELETEQLKIEFIRFKEEWLEGYRFNQVAHVKKATLYGLFIDRAIPQKIDKLIFLDTDILVLSNLVELYNIDLEGNILGAVVENHEEDIIFKKNTLSYMSRYYDSEENFINEYFCKGALLIDMDKYREEEVGVRCVHELKEHPEFVCFEQDALNAICRGRIKYIDHKWNRVWRRELADGRKGTGCMATMDKDISIVHYCTGAKPWLNPEYKLANLFWNVAYDSPWYEELVEELKEKNAMKMFLYKFPWSNVDSGERIFLYGNGTIGKAFLKQLIYTGYCDVIAMIDKNKDQNPICEERGIDVISIDKLKDIYSGEKIIISISDKKIQDEVSDILVELGCDINKIIKGEYLNKEILFEI